MTDYRITITAQNAKLLSMIDRAGYDSRSEFSRDNGICYSSLCRLVSLKKATNKNGDWLPIVIKLCEVLNCIPEDIFTEAQAAGFDKNKSSADMDEEKIELLHSSSFIPQSQIDEKITLEALIETLIPRQQEAVRLRIGGATFEDVGRDMKPPVGKARAAQLVSKAERLMRHRFNRGQRYAEDGIPYEPICK